MKSNRRIRATGIAVGQGTLFYFWTEKQINMALEASELILNEDGSIYHLNLQPDQLSDTIITVGDPDRVDLVTSFFDHIECKVRKREFHTQTGSYKGKRISVVSTGIGTDNIDIVFNELDALANIDLKNRKLKEQFTPLNFIRIGTSGSLHKAIPVDSFLLSEAAVGFDSLLYYYDHQIAQPQAFLSALESHLQLHPRKSKPFYIPGDRSLFNALKSEETYSGITATNVGFYAPQGRVLRAKNQDPNLMDKVASFSYENRVITNMEMETSGIYTLSKILGHRALSANAIIANRATGAFSANPVGLTQKLIAYVLDKLVSQ